MQLLTSANCSVSLHAIFHCNSKCIAVIPLQFHCNSTVIVCSVVLGIEDDGSCVKMPVMCKAKRHWKINFQKVKNNACGVKNLYVENISFCFVEHALNYLLSKNLSRIIVMRTCCLMCIHVRIVGISILVCDKSNQESEVKVIHVWQKYFGINELHYL